MLMIRLQRIGRKHEPAFRLVLTDSKNSTKSGKFLEILGNYDSRHGEKAEFKADRISHWMGHGAQVSDTVHNLLIDKKLIAGKKINKLPKKSAIAKATVESGQTTAETKTETAPTPEATPTTVEEPVAETAPEAPTENPVEVSTVETDAPTTEVVA